MQLVPGFLIGTSVVLQVVLFSTVQAQGARLPDNLISPEEGVVCNGQAKVCYDTFGVTIGITNDIMGQEAADKLAQELSAVDEKYFDRSNFNPAQGISCHTLERRCYEDNTVNDLLSTALFGDDAGTYGPEVLIDVPWAWGGSRYNNNTEVLAKDGRTYSLRFIQDGLLQIKADCNMVRGSYHVEGRSLSIKLGASTKMACGPDIQDQQFLKDLEGVAVWFLKKGKLYLDIKVDTGTMDFYRGTTF